MKNTEKMSTKPTVLKSQESLKGKNLQQNNKRLSIYLSKEEIMVEERKMKEE